MSLLTRAANLRNRPNSAGAALCGVIFILLTTTAPVMGQTAPLAVKVPVSQLADLSGVKASVQADYAQLPLAFEANQGQVAASEVRYLAHGQNYGIALTDREAILSLRKQPTAAGKRRGVKNLNLESASSAEPKTDVIRMRLLGAQSGIQAVGKDKLVGRINYLIGKDPKKWHTDLPTYGKVSYNDVYPGVDLVYYGNQGRLEYDFVVAPGADTRAIILNFDGAKSLHLDPQGNLEINAVNGSIAFEKPVIYQERAGQRESVNGRFKLEASNNIGFLLGPYDHSRALVIDPILAYSTYLGGSAGQPSADSGIAIAVDSTGSTYVTGTTTSAAFPVTQGAFQVVRPDAGGSIYVSKLTDDGSGLIFSTYLGGSGGSSYNCNGDVPSRIAVDTVGDVFVTGCTASPNFPTTTGAFQTMFPVVNTASSVAFVTKLNSSGDNLVYSTLLGGSGITVGTYCIGSGCTPPPGATAGDNATGLAIDSDGDVYVAGQAASLDFPVTQGAFQTTSNQPYNNGLYSGESSGFLVKLNPTGSGLLYSTYLSGNPSSGAAVDLKVDSGGNAYILSDAYGSSFPTTTGAFQTVIKGSYWDLPGFRQTIGLSKLDPTGATLLYSTFIGGSSGEQPNSLVVDSSGNAYVVGGTASSDYPVTSGAYQQQSKLPIPNNPDGDPDSIGVVTKVNASGSGLIYSTYLGGTGSILTDPQVTGVDYSTDSYLLAASLDSSGTVWVTGTTESTDFPVTSNAYQSIDKIAPGYPSLTITGLNPSGSGLVYSTWLSGSTSGDTGHGIATDFVGNVYVIGQATSQNFPVTSGAFQTTMGKYSTGATFVAKLQFYNSTSTALAASASQIIPGASVTLTAKVSPSTVSGTATFLDGSATLGTGTLTAGVATYTTSGLATGVHSITAVYGGTTANNANGQANEASSTSPAVSITVAVPTPTPGIMLSPTSLTFGAQAMGSTSASQMVSVSNPGTAPLTLSIAASGDFAETNTCGSSVAVGASCTIAVIFTPMAAGTRNGAVTITDNAVGSPQTVSLSGTGDTVSVASSLTSLSISSPGGSATATLTVSSVQGFSGAVNLTCAVTYQGQGAANDPPTCSISPSQVTVSGATSPTAALTISTMAASARMDTPESFSRSGEIVCALLVFGFLPRRSRKYRAGLLLSVLLLLVTSMTIGCSSGNSNNSGSTGSTGNSGATTGTYSIVVTATGAAALSSITIPLNLQ